MTSSRVFAIRSIAVACVILAFTLAASLGLAAATPGNAYAGSKTTIYVVSKAVHKSGDYEFTNTYTYKNGLLTTTKTALKHDGSVSNSANTYIYNSKNALQRSVVKSAGKTQSTTTYQTNSKGWVTKMTVKYPGVSQKNTYKLAYKNGKLSKSSTSVSTTTYKYYDDGNLKSLTTKYDTDSYTISLKYDKKGFVKKRITTSGNYKNAYTFKNTYKSGRLAKQVSMLNNKVDETTTYTYKRVSIPKSLAKMVQAQQTSIVKSGVPFEAAHK